MSDDDLLGAGEIEALLNQQMGGGAAPSPAKSAGGGETDALSQDDLEALLQGVGATSSSRASETLQPGDIDALLKSAGAGRSSSPPPRSATAARAESLLDQVDRGLNEALSPNSGRRNVVSGNLPVTPFGIAAFSAPNLSEEENFRLDALQDVELDVRIELGRTELLVEDVLKLREGSVVPLDKLAGDPVDILVNGRLVARGEVLVLNDNFCVRIAEILSPGY